MMEPPVRTPDQPLGMKGCQLEGWMKLMTEKTKMRMAMSLKPTIHHHVVGGGGLANAAHQNDGDEHDDEEGGDVEAEVPAGVVDIVAGKILEAVRKIGGRDPSRAGMEAEPIEQVDDVGGEADADAHVGTGVFEDEIPADDPGDELAERGVGIGVGGAGDGNHGGQLGVAKAGERADEGHQDHGERDGGTGAGTAGERGVRDDVVDERRIGDGGVGKLLAGDGGADDGEDARADDGADAERGERPRAEALLQRVLGFFRVADELVDRLAGKQLAGQCGASNRRS